MRQLVFEKAHSYGWHEVADPEIQAPSRPLCGHCWWLVATWM